MRIWWIELAGLTLLAVVIGTSPLWAEEEHLPSKFQGNWCASEYPPASKGPITLLRLNDELYTDYEKCDLPQQTVIHEDTIDDGIRGVCTRLSARRIDQDTYQIHHTDICGDGAYKMSDWIYHLEEGMLMISPVMPSAVGHSG